MAVKQKKNYIMYVLVILLIAASFGLGHLYTKVKMLEKGTGGGIPSTVPTSKPVDITVSDSDPQLGSKDAKLTVVEFADFQCPFCGAFSGLNPEMVQAMKSRDASWVPALPDIKKEYVDTGKVRFVWKDYPFLGQESIFAAAAARCAQDQGKFWEYHDYLFSHQKGENEGAFSKENLKSFAANLGLKTADFNKCLDGGKNEAGMQEALTRGQSVGVNGTPATFVNGKLISGAAPFSQFKSAIEAELK